MKYIYRKTNEDGRVPTVITPVWDSRISLSQNLSSNCPKIPDKGEFLTLLARTGQYFKIEYDLASYYESAGKEWDPLTVFNHSSSLWDLYLGSLTQDYFYPKADLIFQVQMDQKEEHFHIVLLITPFSYMTDVSDG